MMCLKSYNQNDTVGTVRVDHPTIMAKPALVIDAVFEIDDHEEDFSRAHTPPKDGGSPVPKTPTNYSRQSYEHRETGNTYNSRAPEFLFTDILMMESDCDIPATPPVSPAPSRLRDGSETYDDDAESQAARPHTPSSAKRESHNRNMGVCTISQAEAVIIFLSGSRHGSYGSRGNLSDRLSKEFGITPKAVRDIWNLRTWTRDTRPHWTPLDEENFTKKKSLSAFCDSKRKPKTTRQTYHNISKCTSTKRHRSKPDFQMPTYSNRLDGEWMIDPSFIAQDFKVVLMEWHDIVRHAYSPLQPVSCG